MAAPLNAPGAWASSCLRPSGSMRTKVERASSTSSTEPSASAIGPSGNSSPVAMMSMSSSPVSFVGLSCGSHPPPPEKMQAPPPRLPSPVLIRRHKEPHDMHPPLRSRFWSDLSSQEFSRLDRERLIAVLPLGAIEQHGPHLPMSTDTATIDAMVRASLAHLPDALPVLFLPTLAYGKSNEHARYPGTLTLSASTSIALCKEIGACVARAGVRKLVLYNSHGGQMSVMDIVARDLRQEQSMMV